MYKVFNLNDYTYYGNIPATFIIIQITILISQVCHSKNGDINPLKIQKLVKGYVKKVSYIHKRQTI